MTLLGSAPGPEGSRKNKGEPADTDEMQEGASGQADCAATDVPSACIGKHRGKRPGVSSVSPENS